MNFLRPMRLEEKYSKFCLEKFFSPLVTYEILSVLNEVNDDNITINTSLNVKFSIDIIKLISILQTKTKQNLDEKLSISKIQGFHHLRVLNKAANKLRKKTVCTQNRKRLYKLWFYRWMSNKRYRRAEVLSLALDKVSGFKFLLWARNKTA